MEAPFVTCAPLAVACSAVVEAVHASLGAGAAHDELLTALRLLFDSPLDCLDRVVKALHTLRTLTSGCGLEHPAYPIYQKHATLHMGCGLLI